MGTLNLKMFQGCLAQLVGDDAAALVAHENAGRGMARLLKSAGVHPSELNVWVGSQTDLVMRQQATIDRLIKEHNAAYAANRPLQTQVATQKTELSKLKRKIAEGLDREQKLSDQLNVAKQSIKTPNKSELMSKIAEMIDEEGSGVKLKEALDQISSERDQFRKDRTKFEDELFREQGLHEVSKKTIQYMKTLLSLRAIQLCEENGLKYCDESEIVGDFGWLRGGKP